MSILSEVFVFGGADHVDDHVNGEPIDLAFGVDHAGAEAVAFAVVDGADDLIAAHDLNLSVDDEVLLFVRCTRTTCGQSRRQE